MNRLKINEEYELGSDGQQFILYRKRIVQDKKSKNFGEEYWDVDGYYTSIKGVMGGMAEQNMLENWPDLKKILDLNKKIYELAGKIHAELLGCECATTSPRHDLLTDNTIYQST